MKPAISVGGRTDTAHNPTVGEWGTPRCGTPGLWPGTPRLQSWEDVRLPLVPDYRTSSLRGDGYRSASVQPTGLDAGDADDVDAEADPAQ